MNWKDRICRLNIGFGQPPRTPSIQSPNCSTYRRLALAFSRLEDLQLIRSRAGDPLFGKSSEERIIWRELLELELQEVDEQIERITAAAGDI